MPWAAGQKPGQPASPRRGEGSSSAQVFLPSVNLTRSSEAVGEEERGDEKETTFIEPPPPQLRARPLSPLVVHSRGEEDEGGEEGEEDSLDCSTEETPVQVRILSFLKYQGLTTGG